MRAKALSHLGESVEAFTSLLRADGASEVHAVADGFLLALCGAGSLQVWYGDECRGLFDRRGGGREAVWAS